MMRCALCGRRWARGDAAPPGRNLAHGKQGESWDAAYAAPFLASDALKYVNATELVGGLTAATPGPPRRRAG
jgi:hypothetical protein